MNPSWPLNIDVPCAQPLLLVIGANRPDAGLLGWRNEVSGRRCCGYNWRLAQPVAAPCRQLCVPRLHSSRCSNLSSRACIRSTTPSSPPLASPSPWPLRGLVPKAPSRSSLPQSRCRAHTLRRIRAAPAKARKQRRSARPAARCTGAARTCSCAQLAVGAACAQSAPYAAPSGALIRRSFAISARGSPKVARMSRRLPPWPTSSARSAAV